MNTDKRWEVFRDFPSFCNIRLCCVYKDKRNRKDVMIMEFDLSHYTHQGQRDYNEDDASFVQANNALFAVVADGLGGHKNGKMASQMVVQSMIRTIRDSVFDEDQLILSIQKADRLVKSEGECGLSTVAALWIKGAQALAAHVGDTRIYQFRDGRIIFQSTDHSFVQVGVSTGRISPEEARTHKDRNKLLRALGNEEPAKADCRVLNLRAGDAFLLCTDGLWEGVTEERMLSTLRASENSPMWLSRLYQLVKQRNYERQDNHTAIAIMVRE